MEERLDISEEREQKIRDNILDESFRKAESSRNFKSSLKEFAKKPLKEKQTSKTGIYLILIAIACLLLIQFGPWAIIQYNADYGSEIIWISRDAKTEGITSQDIITIFSQPNYIGVTIHDFTDVPAKATSGFLILILLALVFIMFQMLDKFRDFSEETFCIVISFFSALTNITALYIAISVIKFLGAYILIVHNIEMFSNIEVIIVFLTPIIILAITLAIVKSTYSVIRIYFSELEKRMRRESVKHSIFTKKMGGKF